MIFMSLFQLRIFYDMKLFLIPLPLLPKLAYFFLEDLVLLLFQVQLQKCQWKELHGTLEHTALQTQKISWHSFTWNWKYKI